MPVNEPIEAEYTEDAPRHEEKPVASLSREDVQNSARLLTAEATGVSALVEGASSHPKMRRDFVQSWRRWFGAWMAFWTNMERQPFNLEQTRDAVAKQHRMLQVWRVAMRQEIEEPRVQMSNAPTLARPATWPWFVIWPAAAGVAYGSFKAIQYTFDHWLSSSSKEEEKPSA
jgi:plasmid maintenance system antidote protein VapI